MPDKGGVYHYYPVITKKIAANYFKVIINPDPTQVKFNCTNLHPGGDFRVVLVHDNYHSLKDFEVDAKIVTKNFYTNNLPPELKSKINFSMAESEDFINIQKENPNYTFKDNPVLTNQVAAACSAEYVVAISQEPDAGWCNSFPGTLAHLYSGDVRDQTYVISHELGHCIAALGDEYDIKNPQQNDNVRERINCASESKCLKWQNKSYAKDIGCYKRCYFQDRYRSKEKPEESIMDGHNDAVFNPPSLEGWAIALNHYSGDGLGRTLHGLVSSENSLYNEDLKLQLIRDNSEFKLNSSQITSGYPQRYTDDFGGDFYKINILDDKNSILFSGKTRATEERMYNDYSTTPPKASYESISLNSLDLNLPVFSSMKKIEVKDKADQIKATIDTKDIQVHLDENQNLCGNGICDAAIGENVTSCRADCQAGEDLKLKASDVNNDSVVNTIDYAIILINYDKPQLINSLEEIKGDVNADGVVNSLDASIVIENLGKTVN